MNHFEWDCIVIDGHNYQEIFRAFDFTAAAKRPAMILANTIKGKGVSFIEGHGKWQHKIPNEIEMNKILEELK